MPRRPGKGGSGETTEEQPRAGDTARQIGEGFFKIASVIDEYPPLAKLFEGGFLERRFQEVFQGASPSVTAGGSSDGGSGDAGVSERLLDSGDATLGGDAKEVATEGKAEEREGGNCEGARGQSSEAEGQTWLGMGTETEAAASEAAVSETETELQCSGVRVDGRKDRASEERGESSALRDSRPSPSLQSFAAPPPRAAAAAALERISAPKRCGEKSAGTGVGGRKGSSESEVPAATDSADRTSAEALASDPGIVRKASPRLHPVESSLDGTQPEEETAVKGLLSRSSRGRGVRNRPLSSGIRSSSEPPSKAPCSGDASDSTSGSPGYPFRSRKRSASGEGGGPNYSEVGDGRRRRTEAEMLEALDSRVFIYFRPGECREKSCKLRREAHCHRGPGCDCTRNSETYKWPSEHQSMMRHQERHRDWNNKPSFGKRVLVKFADGNFYPGTINTQGESARDRKHSRGRWGVLFDDCTRDRFEDNASDVMVTNQPRPPEVTEELRDYYLTQENGEKLLVGLKVVSNVSEAESEAEEEVQGEEVKPAQKRRGAPSKGKSWMAPKLKKPRAAPMSSVAKCDTPSEATVTSESPKHSGGKRKGSKVVKGGTHSLMSVSAPESSRSSGKPCKMRKQESTIEGFGDVLAAQRSARESRARARGASRKDADDDRAARRQGRAKVGENCGRDGRAGADLGDGKGEPKVEEKGEDDAHSEREGRDDDDATNEERRDVEKEEAAEGEHEHELERKTAEDDVTDDTGNLHENMSEQDVMDEAMDALDAQSRSVDPPPPFIEGGQDEGKDDELGFEEHESFENPSDAGQEDDSPDLSSNPDLDGNHGQGEGYEPTAEARVPGEPHASPLHVCAQQADCRDPITPDPSQLAPVGWFERGEDDDDDGRLRGSRVHGSCEDATPPLESNDATGRGESESVPGAAAASRMFQSDRRRAAVLSIADLTAVENPRVSRKESNQDVGGQQRAPEWVSVASSDASPKPHPSLSATDAGDDDHGAAGRSEDSGDILERRANVVPISASDPHALEVAHVMISAMGMIG